MKQSPRAPNNTTDETTPPKHTPQLHRAHNAHTTQRTPTRKDNQHKTQNHAPNTPQPKRPKRATPQKRPPNQKTSAHYHTSTRHVQSPRTRKRTQNPQKHQKPPAYTRGEKQKYPDMPKHRNSSFFSKTVKTGPHQVKHYPVCQNNIKLSLTKTITNDHVIQRYITPHLHRVQSRGQPSQPQSRRLSPTCFKSYGGYPSSSQKRTRYQQSNTHKDLQPSSISDTPTKSSPPESSRTTISQVINT